MNPQHEFYINTKSSRLFFRASIPGAIGMMASNIYFVLEMLLIGRLIGEDAFAAGNLALPLILINFALADMIAVGSSIGIAIKLGERKEEEADRIFTTAVITAVLCSAFLSLILITLGPIFFSLMGAEGNLLKEAVIYLRVYALFTPLTSLVFVFDNYLRICGRVRLSMNLNILMSFLCLFLEFIFLYVLDLGIAFAALGTSLGMSITCILSMLPFIKGGMALKFTKIRNLKETLKSIFTQGLPSFLNNTSGKITSILMNSLLLHYGGAVAVSIYGVFMNIDGIIIPGMYGVFDSLQPAIGYNWGAGRKDRVRKITLYSVIAIAFLCILFALLLEIFPSEIFSLFLKSDSTMLILATHAIMIMGLTYFVRWISYACQSFSSAIGKSGESTVLSLCNALIFPLIMMLILKSFRLEGLWYATPLAALLTAITAVIIYITRLHKLVAEKHNP